LDLVLCEYAEALFAASDLRGIRQKYFNTVFGIEFLIPTCKERASCARQAVSGWDRVVLASSPPPLSHAVLSALVCWLLDTGQSGVGLAHCVPFFGYIQASETLDLRRSDVVLPGDTRLPPAAEIAGLLIRDAKTGKNQFVEVRDPFRFRSLERFCAGMNEATRLFPYTYTHNRSMFQGALKGCGLAAVGYKLHSLGHGGATRALLLGVPRHSGARQVALADDHVEVIARRTGLAAGDSVSYFSAASIGD
jgi:hypothetical protein